MLMTRREAQRRGLPVMATLRSFATVGVPPGIMGTAPTKAIPAALHKAGLSKDDIDMFELNEAFASQVGRPALAGAEGGGIGRLPGRQSCPAVHPSIGWQLIRCQQGVTQLQQS